MLCSNLALQLYFYQPLLLNAIFEPITMYKIEFITLIKIINKKNICLLQV